MGTGWKRAFCNTVPKSRREASTTTTTTTVPPVTVVDKKQQQSNPSSPHLRCRSTNTNNNKTENDINLISPKLHCKTTPKSHSKSPRILVGSNPSSPRSPFSILKNTLRLSKNSCGVCTQSVKAGQGMAIYTAECSHAFHFPCVASHVRKHDTLVCPVCHTIWKDVPLLSIHKASQNKEPQQEEEKIVVVDSNTPTKKTPISSPKLIKQGYLKSYADDEPLVSPKLNPIPKASEQAEAVEFQDVEEFQGFFVNPISSSHNAFECRASRNVEVSILPEAAVISVGQTHETYAVVLKVKAPPPPPPLAATSPQSLDAVRRAPIDLVTVLDVSGSMSGAKLQMLKRAMRLVISSLGSADRLSIVAFCSTPKRLIPLMRMTAQGQRSARRIIDRLACSHGSSMGEALKQATKVLEDRRERNPVASIILLSDGQDDIIPASDDSNQPHGLSHVSSTRFNHIEIPVNSSSVSSEKATGFSHEPADAFSKCVGGLLSVVVHDLKIQLGFAAGSDPAEILAVYSCSGQPTVFSSSCIGLGNLYAEEEREVFVEIRVPISLVGSHHVFSVGCSYKDPAIQEVVYNTNHALLVPRPHSVQSGLSKIQQLRYAFISTRAIAESRRLIEYNELSSAAQLLSSARALLLQLRSELAHNYIRGIEATLAEVQWRQYQRVTEQREIMVCLKANNQEMGVFVDENVEPITPKLSSNAIQGQVAHVKKPLNRVRDLHGFENARF